MRWPLFIIRFVKFEYWPWWMFYLPVLPYWLWLALKNRSLAYFSAANPGIELGGFFGESKSGILRLIEKDYLPKTLEIDHCSGDSFELMLEAGGIGFPLIAKPDVGERGQAVMKIADMEALKKYHLSAQSRYIIQEYVDYEIELGVLYSRNPGSQSGKVSSVTRKEFLSVTGDGISSVKQLMNKSTRARFQVNRLSQSLGEGINEVLPAGEQRLLEPIGNHCRGTRFIDNNFLINDELHRVFDKISLPIEGFYYGRFDLKVKSIEDLYAGRNIRIMELNGASSEPGHIYDSSNSLFKAYRDLLAHWERLAQVSKENMARGIKPVPFSAIASSYFKFVLFKPRTMKT